MNESGPLTPGYRFSGPTKLTGHETNLRVLPTALTITSQKSMQVRPSPLKRKINGIVLDTIS